MAVIIWFLTTWILAVFGLSFISTEWYMYLVWVLAGFVGTWVLLLFLIYFIMLPIFKCLKPNNKIKHAVSYQFFWFIAFICRSNIKIVDKHKLLDKSHKDVVYVANHKSKLDPFWMYIALRRPCTAISKSTLANVIWFRPIMHAYNVICFDRENDRVAAKQMIDAIKLLKGGLPLMIFPEGGIRTREVEQMVALRAGAYRLAIKSNSIVQPFAIFGNSKVHFRSIFAWSTIVIKVLDPIYPEDYAGMNTQQLGKLVVERVNKEFSHERKFELDVKE